MKDITETYRAYYIRYIRLYCYHWVDTSHDRQNGNVKSELSQTRIVLGDIVKSTILVSFKKCCSSVVIIDTTATDLRIITKKHALTQILIQTYYAYNMQVFLFVISTEHVR
jgi:hypothetical protein